MGMSVNWLTYRMGPYPPITNMIHLATTSSQMDHWKAENNPYRFSTKYFDSEIELYYYGYRYYSPELGRWISRDSIEERGGLNLYAGNRNNFIIYIDPFGLQCKKTYGVGVNWRAEVAAYGGIGGSASLEVSGTIYDCCCDTDLIPSDAYEIAIEAAVDVGFGAGGHVVFPGLGRLGGTIQGPQLSRSMSVSVSKDCSEDNPSFTWKLIEISGDIGGSFSGGIDYGGSVGIWAKYGISFQLSVSEREAKLEGIVGWKGGGEAEINTPFVNMHFYIAPWDYTWKPKNLSQSW